MSLAPTWLWRTAPRLDTAGRHGCGGAKVRGRVARTNGPCEILIAQWCLVDCSQIPGLSPKRNSGRRTQESEEGRREGVGEGTNSRCLGKHRSAGQSFLYCSLPSCTNAARIFLHTSSSLSFKVQTRKRPPLTRRCDRIMGIDWYFVYLQLFWLVFSSRRKYPLLLWPDGSCCCDQGVVGWGRCVFMCGPHHPLPPQRDGV